MSVTLPTIYLVRHGETEWTLSGQHTGRTDLPLIAHGEEQARRLRSRLEQISFSMVYCSPLRRAVRTCELAGYGASAEVDPDLIEWDYGDYEGKKRAEILAVRPNWTIFRDGCPNGELPGEVATRADRVVHRAQALKGNILLFSSGHFLRLFVARWLGLEPSRGALFKLGTAAISVLGYDHNSRHEPVLQLLNERFD